MPLATNSSLNNGNTTCPPPKTKEPTLKKLLAKFKRLLSKISLIIGRIIKKTKNKIIGKIFQKPISIKSFWLFPFIFCSL